MLDIRRIRTNLEECKRLLSGRNGSYDLDALLAADDERRALIAEADAKKAQLNSVSKEIGIRKSKGEDTSEVMASMKALSDSIKEIDLRLREAEEKVTSMLLAIPNIPNESVPVGSDDSANVEVRRVGDIPEFGFEPKAHWELGEKLGILDPDRAAKVTGARFHFYKGLGARLERAVMCFFLDTHTANGYTEIFPPFMANRASMTGTGQLPKFEEDAYKVTGTDCFLIPTAEVPVTNYHRDEILDGTTLPLRYCAYSACFRAEAGSAGRDTRGLIRQHQFNKVELVKFTTPEQSYEELEELTNEAELTLKLLGLPYRVVTLCSGDLGFSSAKTYDIEVYMPSYGRYVEISSCSNFEDYQARRMSIRFKREIKGKAELVHTLNGSGLAIGRTTAAIIENFQQADGSVVIPEVLRKYMGCDVIRP